MKKILYFLLISLNLTVIGCAQTEIKNDTEVNTSISNTENEVQNKKSEGDEIKVIELNKPFNVETEHGAYSFTIKSVTKTDWWEKNKKNTEKTVILLNLECENTDFTNKDNTGYEGVNLYNAFTIKDDNNYMLEHFSTSYENVNMGTKPIPKNTKGKISMPFIAENNIQSVTIQFNRGGIIEDIPITE